MSFLFVVTYLLCVPLYIHLIGIGEVKGNLKRDRDESRLRAYFKDHCYRYHFD